MVVHDIDAGRDRSPWSAVLIAALLLVAPGLVIAQPMVTSPTEAAAGQSAAAQAAASRRDPSLGVLRIVVLDASGAAILGSQVTVHSASGIERTATANERGEAIFENLPPGKYVVHAESAGFDAFDVPDQNVKRGQNNREVTLKIANFVDQVEVTRDKTDERMSETFSSGLSKEEIDELPDDPDEMQQVLEQMAGPGASMFVNGFTGGRMPPKSQIQSIRFRFDPYSADNHDAGRPRIDVQTRPGNGEWRNSATFTFRDESLNARYPQAPSKTSEQARRGFWSLEGPLVKGKTSFSLNVNGLDSFDSETINARMSADQSNLYRSVVQQPTKRLNVNARVEHAINKNHTLRVEFERQNNNQDNLGVGGQNLEESAYSQDRQNTEFRISESGLFGKYRNDIRVQYEETTVDLSSLSNTYTLNVQGNFKGGGAQMSGGTRAREVQVSDDLDFALNKKHAMRVGFRIDGGRYFSDANQNTVGTFTYRTIDQYLANTPAQFTVRRGNPTFDYTNVQAAFYVTDDYKLRKNVMLTLGARYEGQTHLDDWNNIAPRISATWSPFKSNRTTVRAGFGIFYDWYGTSTYAQTIQLDGSHQFDQIFYNPDPFNPTGGTGSNGSTQPSIVRQADNLVMPTVRRFSVGVDQQINGWLRLRTNYFNQHGWNELRALNANYPVNGVRPDGSYGNISELQSIGKSDSQGMDFGFNITVPARRIFAFVNYTLAKAEDDGGGVTLSPSNTLATEWGYAGTDIRHRMFAMVSTPVWKALRANVNVRYQSGVRYNVTAGVDTNGDGVFNERPLGFSRNSARGDGQFVMDTRLGWTLGFGPVKTRTGGPGGGGGGPRIIGGPGGPGGGPGGGGGGGMMGGGPGGGDSNKRYTVELFAQANNILNHAVYMNYIGVITADAFGTPTSTQPPRRIELGTRFGF
jgi:outer membrane receptor for ferrienterochelin and colicin